ncbi:hypothetical protein ACTFIR_010500 [Dictyostelium discoideum]
MSDLREINRLNKDEEFEYFKLYSNSNGFRKWNLDEHNIFSKASLEYNFLKPDQMIEILKLVNQHNSNTSCKARTLEELNIHIKVYQNFLNKQQALRSPTTGSLNISAFGNPITSGVGGGLGGLGALGGVGGGGISSSSSLGGLSGSGLFLNTMVNNTFQTILDSLDGNSNNNNNNNNIPSTSSVKDVVSIGINPLFQKSVPSQSQPTATTNNNNNNKQPLELISKPIPTAAATTTTTTIQPPIGGTKNTVNKEIEQDNNDNDNNNNTNKNNNNNNNNEEKEKQYLNYINNSLGELNKKDLKLLNEPWTVEDQKKLEDALTKYPPSRFSSVSRWQMVSKELGISPKAVALRYNQMLNQLIPKKPSLQQQQQPQPPPPTATTTTITIKPEQYIKSEEEEQTTGKRKSRSSFSSPSSSSSSSSSKESPNKKEKTTHDTTTTTTNTATTTTTTTTVTPNITTPSIINSSPAIAANLIEADSLLQKNNQLLKQIRTSVMQLTDPQSTVLAEVIENINNSIQLTGKWKDNIEMPPLPLKVNDLILSLISNNTSSSFKKPLSKKVTEWNLVVEDDAPTQDKK